MTFLKFNGYNLKKSNSDFFFPVGNSISEVEKHLMSQHEEEYLDDENWFEIAQKENIRLECNRCSNSFLSGSFLIFNYNF